MNRHVGPFRALRLGMGLAALAVLLAACASLPLPGELTREAGFYYGSGSASTQAEAAAEARKNLIQLAVIESRERAGIAARVVVSAEVAQSFVLPGIKTVAQGDDGGLWTVVCRLKESEWDAYQQKRMEAARAEILPRLPALEASAGESLGRRLGESASIVDRLYREALADVLTETKDGGALVAGILEQRAKAELASVKLTMETAPGFADASTEFRGRVGVAGVAGAAGPVGPVPLLATWSVRGAEPVTAAVTSAADGGFAIPFPKEAAFHNRAVTLSLRTAFSDKVYGSAALEAADAGTLASFAYQHFDDIDEYFGRQALVPGGKYVIGAVARDTRAARKEAARTVELKPFSMDTQLVTNALWAMYLAATGSEDYPEYWDNPDYNQDDQPVIGVSYDDAVAFAAWLSERLGQVRRLPTEAEWEVAARGGKDVIYPWGDQAPTDGNYANFSGDDAFAGTSPVGSFPDGLNALGLFDMAGNVWQWTSTPRDSSSANRIVKGGSWMDGPLELRISNRRDLSPSKGYADVGIRLVREVTE